MKKHETTALTMNDVRLQIEEYHPKADESEDEVEVRAVKVTNLPPKISKEQIELFFESRKKSGSGSDDLDTVDYDEAAHCAIVWFTDSEGKLKNSGVVKLTLYMYYFIFFKNWLSFILIFYFNHQIIITLKMRNIIRYR